MNTPKELNRIDQLFMTLGRLDGMLSFKECRESLLEVDVDELIIEQLIATLKHIHAKCYEAERKDNE